MKNKYIKRFILAEMISRVIKNTLREKMRAITIAIQQSNQEKANRRSRGGTGRKNLFINFHENKKKIMF